MTALHTWDYLGRVAAALEDIRTANGYHTDAGDVVTREPVQIQLDDDERIVVALTDTTRPSGPMGPVALELTIGIIGQVKFSADVLMHNAQQRLHMLQADIYNCLARRDATLLQHFDRTSALSEWPVPRFIESSAVPPAEGMNWIGVALRYTATIRLRVSANTPLL